MIFKQHKLNQLTPVPIKILTMKNIIWIVILIINVNINCFGQEGTFALMKTQKEKRSISYYLKIKMYSDSTFIYSISEDSVFTISSILGFAKKSIKNKYYSINIYNNIRVGNEYFDNNFLYPPNDTINSIHFEYNLKKWIVKGLNTGLFFGEGTNFNGDYKKINKDTNIYKFDEESSLTYINETKFDTISVYTIPIYKKIYLSKFSLSNRESFLYFPFYVNGFIPISKSNHEVVWLFYPDLLFYFKKLRLF